MAECSSAKKRRKVLEENRVFQSKWEQSYLFVERNGKPQCLVCRQILSNKKKYSVSRHYCTLHAATFDQYIGETRLNLVNDLKSKLNAATNTSSGTSQGEKTPCSAVIASYEVCLEIVKNNRSFGDGEMIKQCAIKMARTLGGVENTKLAANFEKVNLSRAVVARRIDEMNDQISTALKNIINACRYYSIAVAELSNRLAIFIRTIDDNYRVTEEILESCPLYGTFNGMDIYAALASALNEYGFKKCTGIGTDGGKAMINPQTGLINLLSLNSVNAEFVHFIVKPIEIYSRYDNFTSVLNCVATVANLIQKSAKTQHYFALQPFLEQPVGNVVEFSDTRWPGGATNCLQYFANCKTEIINFLDTEDDTENNALLCRRRLQETDFNHAVAFLSDFSRHVNDFCAKTDGTRNIAQLQMCSLAFCKKLQLFKSCFKKRDFAHFPYVAKLVAKQPVNLDSYVGIIDSIATDFGFRFSGLERLRGSIELLVNPIRVAVETQPSDLQFELCELQSDPMCLTRVNYEPEQFWELIDRHKFPKLHDFSLKLLSMFGGSGTVTNGLVSLKNLMKTNATASEMDSYTLDAYLRLSTTRIELNYKLLVQDEAESD